MKTPPVVETLDDDTRMKVLYSFLGTINGLHANLEHVRDGHDPRSPIDHNIEQAQISLEVASMRLQQVASVIEERMGGQSSGV